MKFAIVGASNVGIYTVLYWLFVYFGMNYLIATTIAYLISSISGYLLNNVWVFKENQGGKKSLIKYYVVYGSSYLLNIACMYIWVDVLQLSQTLAPLLTLCVTTPYNFVFNKIWVFNETKSIEADHLRKGE